LWFISGWLFELWKSDGTAAGTIMYDINPGLSGSISGATGYLTNINGVLFFSAGDPANGGELWKYPGNGIASGVSSISINDDLLIYPNPSTGIFQIKNDDLKITAVEIYNVMGEKIYASSKNAENNLTIDISNQPKGIYFVTVYEGTKMYNKKIVVQ